MANPALNQSFSKNIQTTPAGYPTHPGYQPGGQNQAGYGAAPHAGTQQYVNQQRYSQPGYGTPSDLENTYAMPSATSAGMGRLTIDDVVVKTGITLGTVILAAVAAAFLAGGNPGLLMPMWIGGAVVGLILGLVNAFKKEPSVPLILAYAVAEGVFIGAFSFWANALVPGVVAQAVFATLIVSVVCLVLFRTGLVKVTQRFRKILMVALISYAVFCLINLVFILVAPDAGLFGIRSADSVGLPMALGIGLIAVVIAAMTLIADFDSIAQGIRQGAPARYAWSAAFGLTVTLVWMYIEILRILMIIFMDR